MLGVEDLTLSLREFQEKYYDAVFQWYMEMEEQSLLRENYYRILEWDVYGPLKIAFVGEFNHGRSSLINSILRMPDLLPVSSKRQTKVCSYLFPRYHLQVSGFGYSSEHALLVDAEKKHKEVFDFSNLSTLLKDQKLSSDRYSFYIYMDHPLLNKHVVLVDTPGFNLTEEGIKFYPIELAKQSDVIIMVSDLNKSFSRQHEEFISQLGVHTEKLVLVINKADIYTSKQDIVDTLTHVASYQEKLQVNFPKFLYSSINAEQLKDDVTKEVMWDNSLLEYHLQSLIDDRKNVRAKNCTLNILDNIYNVLGSKDGNVKTLLEDIDSVVKNIRSEGENLKSLLEQIENERVTDDTQVNRTIMILEDEARKIVYKESEDASRYFAEEYFGWKKRKAAKGFQRKVTGKFREHILRAIDNFNEYFDSELRNFCLHWFNIMTKILDTRLFDRKLKLSEVEETRQIIYLYLFENHFFWKHKRFRDLLEELESKRYEAIVKNPDLLYGILSWANLFFFDVNSEKYVLNKLIAGCPVPQISDETSSSLSENRWKYQKAPGIFSFGNYKKFRDRIHDYLEDYHNEIFKRLEGEVLKEINKFRTSSRTALQEIELQIRSAYLSKIKEKMEQQFTEQLRDIGKRIEEALNNSRVPLEENEE
ncbi:dynamin family protein [candidate division KSB1 bacterium]